MIGPILVAIPSETAREHRLHQSARLAALSPAERVALAQRLGREGLVSFMAGNKAAAARVLGLDRKTLYRKLIQHRIASRQEP